MSDLLSNLKDFIKNDDSICAEQDGFSSEGFKITDMNQAGFYTKQVIDLKEEQKRISDVAKAEKERLVDQISRWESDEIERLQIQISQISSVLQEFTERSLIGSKKRSIKLPSGTLQLKSTPPKYTYDEEVLKEFFMSSDSEYIEEKIDYKVNKSKIKKDGIRHEGGIVLNGIPIPGISVEDQEDTFNVNPS